MPAQKRLEIAEAFIHAAHRADHVYEDCISGALEAYQETLLEESPRAREAAVPQLRSPVAHVHAQLDLR